MKRLMRWEPVQTPIRTPAVIQLPPMGTEWNAMTLPVVPSADWPASVLFDHAVDRIVRDVFSSGRSLQEAVVHVTELAHTLLPHISDAEIDERVHAQVLANI